MTQETESLSGQPAKATNSASMAADNPPPELDIPQQCSLQWDALMEASDKLDAAALLLEQRAIAMANCIAGLNKPVQPWPGPALGGEYVNATNAPAARASAMSYKRRQIDETIGLIAGARRRLKDPLRAP